MSQGVRGKQATGCCVSARLFLLAWYFSFLVVRVCVCLHALCVWVHMCLKWQNRSFRFFSVSLCAIVLNVLSWTQHTLSTVTRSHWPSVTGLPGLPYTVCPQAVAAIWFTNKSHWEVCPNFCTPRFSARTWLNVIYNIKEIGAKIRIYVMRSVLLIF